MEKMQKLNFPGTHWRGLALICRRPKKTPDCSMYTYISWHIWANTWQSCRLLFCSWWSTLKGPGLTLGCHAGGSNLSWTWSPRRLERFPLTQARLGPHSTAAQPRPWPWQPPGDQKTSTRSSPTPPERSPLLLYCLCLCSLKFSRLHFRPLRLRNRFFWLSRNFREPEIQSIGKQVMNFHKMNKLMELFL